MPADSPASVASANMELSEVLRCRKMVRSFSGLPVPGEVLERVLGAAQRAPSAGNTSGWDAVVLEGPAQTGAFWDATTTADWRARSRRWPGLVLAPVVICVFTNPGAYVQRYGEDDKATSGLGPPGSGRGGGLEAWPAPFWFVDAGFAVLLMLLAAVDAGLGACFLGNFRGETELASTLGVPRDRRYLGAVLLGEPGVEDPPSRSISRERRAASELVHRGRF